MMDEILDTFHSLSGVEGGCLDGPMVNKSPSAFMSALRRHRTCSAAGDHGAVQAWVDDAGKYRGAFMQFRSIVEQQVFDTKAALSRWLTEWLPKMSQP